MSELENEIENEVMDDQVEEVEEVESEEDEPSELAPDSEAEHEENAEDDERRINQEKVNQVINEKHRKWKEAEERAAKLEAQLAQYNSQQQEKAPEIPPYPDAFDDDFEAKVKERDEAIQKRAQWEAARKEEGSKRLKEQQEFEAQQREVFNEKAATYAERAKNLGIKDGELNAAVSVIDQVGFKNDVLLEILEDEDGPLMTKYLATNLVEAYEVSQMPIAKAVLHLERKVRPKLAGLKPKQSNAPKPTTRPKATVGDAELGKYKHLGGAKFE